MLVFNGKSNPPTSKTQTKTNLVNNAAIFIPLMKICTCLIFLGHGTGLRKVIFKSWLFIFWQIQYPRTLKLINDT